MCYLMSWGSARIMQMLVVLSKKDERNNSQQIPINTYSNLKRERGSKETKEEGKPFAGLILARQSVTVGVRPVDFLAISHRNCRWWVSSSNQRQRSQRSLGNGWQEPPTDRGLFLGHLSLKVSALVMRDKGGR